MIISGITIVHYSDSKSIILTCSSSFVDGNFDLVLSHNPNLCLFVAFIPLASVLAVSDDLEVENKRDYVQYEAYQKYPSTELHQYLPEIVTSNLCKANIGVNDFLKIAYTLSEKLNIKIQEIK